MSQLNPSQLTRLAGAYEWTSQVLTEITDSSHEPNAPIIFELSAAVGVLRTLLTREHILTEPKNNAHLTTKAK